jgi:pimeloyl-ACP methyl ester carboxylesterase
MSGGSDPERRHLLPTRRGFVHVREVGSGGVPLLLLHMSPLSSHMWDTMLPLLSTDRRVLAPDRIGFGDSDRLTRPIPFPEYALATLDALDALGVGQLDVLGIHTGSCEAIELATTQPQRVRRIAIVALPALDDHERGELKAHYGPMPEPTPDGSHLQAYWRWWRGTQGDSVRPIELVHARVLDHLRAGPNVWWTYHSVFDYPVGDRAAFIRQPFVLFAPHDDLWEPTRRAAAHLPPHARFVELPHLAYEIFTLHAAEMAGRVREAFDGES